MEGNSDLVVSCHYTGNMSTISEISESLAVNADLAILIHCDSRYVSVLDLDAGLDSCDEPVLDIIFNVC